MKIHAALLAGIPFGEYFIKVSGRRVKCPYPYSNLPENPLAKWLLVIWSNLIYCKQKPFSPFVFLSERNVTQDCINVTVEKLPYVSRKTKGYWGILPLVQGISLTKWVHLPSRCIIKVRKMCLDELQGPKLCLLQAPLVPGWRVGKWPILACGWQLRSWFFGGMESNSSWFGSWACALGQAI